MFNFAFLVSAAKFDDPSSSAATALNRSSDILASPPRDDFGGDGVSSRDVEKQRRKLEKELKARQKEMERRKIKDEKKRVKEAEKAEKEKLLADKKKDKAKLKANSIQVTDILVHILRLIKTWIFAYVIIVVRAIVID